MTNFKSPSYFITRKRKSHFPIFVVVEKSLKIWIKKQPDFVKNQLDNIGNESAQSLRILREENGKFHGLLFIKKNTIEKFTSCAWLDLLKKEFSQDKIRKTSFAIESENIDQDELNNIYIGWGWACYQFDVYKEEGASEQPALFLSKDIDKKRVLAYVDSVNTLRNLINTPANDCGPDELEEFMKQLAEEHKAKISIIKDKQLINKNFPLIYTVGQASTRHPRLIDLSWGKSKDPKLTLVGKGVVFDTGGLNLKPGQYMRHMKKDMGGAAHVLGLAMMIMSLKLPVRLRVLIPAVENSIAGNAFRPGDIIKSRKGMYIENTNTDAEGRLILADALTYACEDNPEMIIDYATLTGSARAGLGPDIPALFSNNADLARDIQDKAKDQEDPVWAMPLWQPYRKHIENGPSDMINSAGIPGDLIYSALFLESFIHDNGTPKTPDWVHLDCYAWEQTGRSGRPCGGADTGMRSIFSYLEQRFGKNK